MDSLAPPLAHEDYNEGRRGSWIGEFEPARRTSFANAFLETPPGYEEMRRTKLPLGSLHHIDLNDEEPDLLSTPPISPAVQRGHHKTPSSYFDTPLQARSGRSIVSQQPEEEQSSLFTTMLSKAFETVSKSGEALDVHTHDAELSSTRKTAKGKSKALPDDLDDEPYAGLAGSPVRLNRPTSALDDFAALRAGRSSLGDDKAADSASAPTSGIVSRDFEDSLVDTIDAVEQKMLKLFSWFTDEPVQEAKPGMSAKQDLAIPVTVANRS